MDTLTILFVGLIAHVMTDSGAQRAVLVSAPLHEARLVIEAGDVLEVTGFTTDAAGRYRLDGERLTIEGLPAGDATFEASYLRHVPSLTKISDGMTLVPEIQNASPHEAVSAYLDLGRGTFSVPEFSSVQLRFGKSRPYCLARVVAFRAPVTGGVVFRTASGKSLRIRGDAVVRISNDPPASTNGTHFHMYARLFSDAVTIPEPVVTGRSCTGHGRRRVTPQTSITVDCSNGNYP